MYQDQMEMKSKANEKRCTRIWTSAHRRCLTMSLSFMYWQTLYQSIRMNINMEQTASYIHGSRHDTAHWRKNSFSMETHTIMSGKGIGNADKQWREGLVGSQSRLKTDRQSTQWWSRMACIFFQACKVQIIMGRLNHFQPDNIQHAPHPHQPHSWGIQISYIRVSTYRGFLGLLPLRPPPFS